MKWFKKQIWVTVSGHYLKEKMVRITRFAGTIESELEGEIVFAGTTQKIVESEMVKIIRVFWY